MAYGDKRNNPKIDIYVDGVYKKTTTWVRTCREAKERFLNAYPDTVGKVTVRFQ
jgi:hypothetical protein